MDTIQSESVQRLNKALSHLNSAKQFIDSARHEIVMGGCGEFSLKERRRIAEIAEIEKKIDCVMSRVKKHGAPHVHLR